MSKRKSLASAMQSARNAKPVTERAEKTAPAIQAVEAKPAEAPATKNSTIAPSRQGKKFIGAYFTPEVSKQLKILAATEDKSVQDLLAQALNLLFQEHHMNPIAQEKK